jgi:hypothetical protein
MTTVESILEKYDLPSELLGAEPAKAPLLEDLNAQKRACNRIYGIYFSVVCVVTLISIAAVIIDLLSTGARHLAVISTAGISVPFMLNSMRRSAEQWSQVTLLITLVSHSDEKAIQSLIKKLLSSKASGFAATAAMHP